MLSLDYIAGLIDGEGSFGIYPKSTRMSICNQHRGVLLAVRKTLDVGRVAQGSRQGIYYFEMGSLGLRRWLPEFIPRLIVKRRLAELLLEYLDPIPVRNRFAYQVSPRELSRREALRQQVCEINRSRGRVAWGSQRGV